MIRVMLFLATIYMTGDAHISSGPDSVSALVAAQIGSHPVLDCGDVAENAAEAEYLEWWTLFPAGNFIAGEHDWLDGCSYCVESINVGDGNIHAVGFDTHFIDDPVKLADLDGMLGGVSPTINLLFTHVPLFTANARIAGDVGAVREALQPLVEAHNVRLVVSGHGHAYEHHVYNGRHYVTIGTGGGALDEVGTSPTLVTALSTYGWLEVDEAWPELTVTFRGLDGAVLDQFSTLTITGIPDPLPQPPVPGSWGRVKTLYR